MTLRDLLLHFNGESYVYVCDSLTGDVLAHGSLSSVMHTVKADDLIVEAFGIGDDGVPVLDVEVF